MAILQAGLGIAVGLGNIHDPSALVRKLAYNRCSGKFVCRFIVMIICALIPLIAFVVPLTVNIDTSMNWKATILWICQSIAFFFALFCLVYLAPIINNKLGFEQYSSIAYT